MEDKWPIRKIEIFKDGSVIVWTLVQVHDDNDGANYSKEQIKPGGKVNV